MLRAWDEATATWNQAANGSPWGTAGALNASDRGTTVLGSFTPSATGLRTITLNAAGIAAVQKWINDPSTNRGFIIQDYANSSGADISTSEAATATQRPKITITYRPGGPIGTPTNIAPNVNAGVDQTIQLPNSASLSGTVDRRRPAERYAHAELDQVLRPRHRHLRRCLVRSDDRFLQPGRHVRAATHGERWFAFGV